MITQIPSTSDSEQVAAEGFFEYDVVGNLCPLVILITNYLRKDCTRPQLCDKWPSFTKLKQKLFLDISFFDTYVLLLIFRTECSYILK